MKKKFLFPLKGVNENWSKSSQPELTTPHAQNVRPYDITAKRARGGQRPGTKRIYAAQVGTNIKPVLAMTQITIITAKGSL